MKEINPFSLTFVKQEKHFILPRISTFVITQNLYDILFQYVITEEKELKLKAFIALLESHIKSKSQAPFSIPAAELDFLEEGLEELRLLNWMEMPVFEFEIKFEDNREQVEEQMEEILDLLDNILTFNRKQDTNCIYVYPASITAY